MTSSRLGMLALVGSMLVMGCNGDATRDPAGDGAPPAPPVADETPADAPRIDGRGIGPVRLGMTAEEVSGLAGARDTAWTDDEGMEARGVVAPVNGAQVLALVARDRVERIHLREPGPRTPEALGVGSTLGELREAYGGPTAGEGHGRLVVWFDAFPGVSFQVEVPPGEEAYQLAGDPDAIPDGARVTELWVR